MKTIYAISVSDDLCDWGEWTVHSRAYTTREAAEEEAERLSGWNDDEVRTYASVIELELVEVVDE